MERNIWFLVSRPGEDGDGEGWVVCHNMKKAKGVRANSRVGREGLRCRVISGKGDDLT
jgi:hypothetical protein